MTTAAVQRFHELTKATEPIEPSELAKIFDQLPPVSPETLIGKWTGGSFDTGHPVHKTLDTLKWAGKDFRSVDDVDPIMVYGEDGKRQWNSQFGHARLREVKYRGVVTAAMVYDNLPIIDAFHQVSDGLLLGAMDAKEWAADGTYYFYISKIQEV